MTYLVGVGHHDSVQLRYLPVANRLAGYSPFVLRKYVDPKGQRAYLVKRCHVAKHLAMRCLCKAGLDISRDLSEI